jgi:hypothetical protein
MQVMESGWNTTFFQPEKAKKVGAKFKALRKVLR